ncbi:stalk domain-containing protein [Paenibacillus pinisoli]|uniref:stalk domain-containing protein n=1 Tax=Paenibacillus pinisoli TaxID=1276110 RepID=UPI001404210B
MFLAALLTLSYQSAIIKNGSIFVPLRGVFEALKADVKWDQATQTVTATKGNTTVVLTIGKTTATVNGKTVTLAAKAEITQRLHHDSTPFRQRGIGR